MADETFVIAQSWNNVPTVTFPLAALCDTGKPNGSQTDVCLSFCNAWSLSCQEAKVQSATQQICDLAEVLVPQRARLNQCTAL